MRLCRRARRCRHTSRAGGGDRAALWGPVPAAAATAPVTAGETSSPALSDRRRNGFFLHLSFATRRPLSKLAPQKPSKSLIFATVIARTVVTRKTDASYVIFYLVLCGISHTRKQG